jgi:hypothetical protein
MLQVYFDCPFFIPSLVFSNIYYRRIVRRGIVKRHDITGILLKVALNTIILTLNKRVVGEKIIKTNNVNNIFLNTKYIEINQSTRY